jgi:uncharacterized protein YjbI with pentapeptide repeats
MTCEVDGKPKAKPENNPWYLLATLYGQPTPDDFQLKARNREAWNRYVSRWLRADSPALATAPHSAEDTRPFSEEELADVKKAFVERHRSAASTATVIVPELKVRGQIDFSNVVFDSPFCADGFFFPVSTDFSRATFSAYADFAGAIFPGQADFRAATFSEIADFEGAIFSGPAHFDGADFYNSDFLRVTFSTYASFEGATFFGVTRFIGASFSDTNFKNATFADPVDFVGAIFSETADFGGATFSGSAVFAGAAFSKDADFDRATFKDGAHFYDATFSSSAMFTHATFSPYAYFRRATFSSFANLAGAKFVLALFEGATFSHARFEGATFSHAFFDGATFSGDACFERASFQGEAVFVNAQMGGQTSFEGTTFRSEPPRFFGAKLHEGTVWRQVTWPIPPTDATTAGRFVDAYERLKLEMDRLKKHEDELDFFARELQCRRVLHGDWKPISELRVFGHTISDPALPVPRAIFAWRSQDLFGRRVVLPLVTLRAGKVTLWRPAFGLAIWVYGVLCNYGRSYVRPMVGLLVTVLVGAVLYFSHFGLSKYPHALGLSIANTFGVFGFRKDFIDPHVIESLSRFLKIVSAFQTLVGIVLLFFFGLAVRNRFRIK